MSIPPYGGGGADLTELDSTAWPVWGLISRDDQLTELLVFIIPAEPYGK